LNQSEFSQENDDVIGFAGGEQRGHDFQGKKRLDHIIDREPAFNFERVLGIAAGVIPIVHDNHKQNALFYTTYPLLAPQPGLSLNYPRSKFTFLLHDRAVIPHKKLIRWNVRLTEISSFDHDPHKS
jgi:hypothetical protein